MTRAIYWTAAVAALAASPLAAQITADDLWNSQTAILTALGATPAGTLVRDGNVVTVTGAGGSWALPLGTGQISWQMGDITLTEQADGSVLTEIGAALDLSFDITITAVPGFTLGGRGQLTATDLVRRSQGTPEAIMTTTTATTLAVDLGELRSPDLGPGLEVTAFVLMEGFDSLVTVTHDGKIGIETRSRTDRLITDVGYGMDGMESRDVSEFRDTSSTVIATLPETPLDLMNLGPALRNGLALQVDGTGGQTRSQSIARGADGVLFSDERQTAATTTQAFWLNAQDGLGLRIAGTDITYAMSQAWLELPELGGKLASLGFSLRLPLLAGQGRQTGQFGFDFTGLSLNTEVFGLLGLPGTVFDHPADFAVDLRADYEPVVDLTDVMTVGTLLDAGESPLTLFGVTLENLMARYDGAELTGTGAFGWDADGEPLTEFMNPPQGEATFDLTGAYAVLDRLSQSGALPQDALLGARAALAGFGRAVGADHLRSVITLGPDGPRVNGAPVPF